jgi:hypothetical protein
MSAQEQRRRLIATAIKDFIVIKFAQQPTRFATRQANLLRLFDATPVPLSKKIAARIWGDEPPANERRN